MQVAGVWDDNGLNASMPIEGAVQCGADGTELVLGCGVDGTELSTELSTDSTQTRTDSTEPV
eukprot:446489-Rhodomonas_salina.1